MTKSECTALIERLERVPNTGTAPYEYMHIELRIGDVFKKIMLEYGKKEGDSLYPYYGVVEQHVQLAEKWAYCGYNKSLQNILKEADWEESVGCSVCGFPCSTICDGNKITKETLKSPAKELFLFLDQLFPNK